MSAGGKWYPERSGLTWIVQRRLWSDFLGTAYEVCKYKNGLWRRFWTRRGAQQRADQLNAQEGLT